MDWSRFPRPPVRAHSRISEDLVRTLPKAPSPAICAAEVEHELTPRRQTVYLASYPCGSILPESNAATPACLNTIAAPPGNPERLPPPPHHHPFPATISSLSHPPF